MPESLFFSPVFILLEATLLGAFLGLQREMIAQKSIKDQSFMGLRTMALLSLLGATSTLFPKIQFLPVIFFGIVAILVAIAYAHGSFAQNRIGMTTEFSALMTFWIGVLVGSEQSLLAILITIFLAGINTYKESLHHFAQTLENKEWIGAFQLLVFSGAVLPFLPNETIDPFGIFNPFKIWLLVLIISGIGFIGYFLIKYLGPKGGIPILSFLGALTSSTATTVSLAEKSKSWGMPNMISCGVMISQGVMLMRIATIILVLSPHKNLPILSVLGIMGVISFFIAFIFFKISQKKGPQKKQNFSTEKIQSPFQIGPAIKFGIFFTGILFVLNLAKKYFGSAGIYTAAGLSGLVDADATVLSSLESIQNSALSLDSAQTAIFIAILVNTAIKAGFVASLGTKEAFKKVSLGVVIILLSGILAYWL